MRTRGIVGGRLAIGLVAIGLAACGFSAVGAQGGDVTTNGEGGSSAGGEAGGDGDGGGLPGDVMAVVQCDSGLVDSRLVILPADGSACPAGTTERTVQMAPQAKAGACTCGTCTPITKPTCAGANFTWTWGGSNSCTSGTQNYNVTADSACVTIFTSSTPIDVYNRWNRVPQGGSCTAAAVGDATKVTTTAVRQCVPNVSAGVCAAVAAGQRTCLPGDGGACTGMFSVPVVVGDGATLACEKCGCALTATACNVEYHDTSDCSATKKYGRLADNQCLMTGQPTMRAIKVYPTEATCAATPGLATAQLTKSRTLCCTP